MRHFFHPTGFSDGIAYIETEGGRVFAVSRDGRRCPIFVNPYTMGWIEDCGVHYVDAGKQAERLVQELRSVGFPKPVRAGGNLLGVYYHPDTRNPIALNLLVRGFTPLRSLEWFESSVLPLFKPFPSVRLTDRYSAIIGRGFVEVGCQKIDNAKVEELANAIDPYQAIINQACAEWKALVEGDVVQVGDEYRYRGGWERVGPGNYLAGLDIASTCAFQYRRCSK